MALVIPKNDEQNFQDFVDAFFTEIQSSGVASGGELSALQLSISNYRASLAARVVRFNRLADAKLLTVAKKQEYVDARTAQSVDNTDYGLYKTYTAAWRSALVLKLREFYARIHAA